MSADRDRETRLAEALAEHFTRTFTPTGTGFTLVGCGCGWRGSEWIHIDDAAREHREHIAAELLALPALRAAGEGDRLRRDLAALAEAHGRIVAEATDLCWKATPFASDEDGFVASYLLPVGVVHRLLGALQGAGYSAAFRNPNLLDGGEGGR